MRNVTDNAHMTSHRLLLVSYWYPPAIGAAAERIHAFAKYLPDHGWHTHVLTAGAPDARACSHGPRSGQEPEGATLCTVADPLAPKTPTFPDYDPTARPSTLRTWLRELVFPDRFMRWQRAAFRPALNIIRRRGADVLFASFPPASVVLLGLRLHRETGIPLVIDYRDRWLGPGGYEPRLNTTRRRHARLERDAIAHATGIITVSDAMADALADEQGFDRGRIFVIPNGYEPHEPTDLADSPSGQESASTNRQSSIVDPQSPGPLTIAHVGTVIPRNRPDLFFESITALKGRGDLSDVTFKFVGNLSRDYLDDAGLTSIVKTTGLLPRDQASQQMQRAHALLLLTGSYVGRWGRNAKLFEYLQTGRPILCLEEAPDSNDRTLLEQFARNRVFFAPIDGPEAIAAQITKLRHYVGENPTPALEMDPAFRDYSRPKLTAQLALCLARLVGSE
ncbi:MAG: glycosyltransferase [Phycisphaerae bacterium]|nr:glycosyltransferase [Phycisphaerae bacterium]